MNREQLQTIFQNPYSARDWQEVLIEIFGITKRYRTPQLLESSTNEKVEGYELGRIRTKDGYEIGVFEFEIKTGDTIEMSRVGLRGLVSSYVNYNVDAALVVYHSTTQWRLSFISNLKGESTTPKRFTYVFGDPKQLYRTPIDRFVELEEKGILFSTIYEAFSVEKLNDDFFKAYKGLYSIFCNKLPDGKASRDFVKRMMGRLVFLHFVQKKGWLGNDQHYLQNLLKNSKENYYDTFLTDVLHVLFFDTLNEKRKDDKVNPILGKNIRIPYLNGGLFEADEADRQGINFPFEYFDWLLNFFSLFNFTIDENDPSDAEVGIDPEMLGHIFENLLEDNKDKGAFYTPKEIVRYMCQESLLQFLGKNDELKFKTFADIFCIEDKVTATKVNNLLTSVKICDPAIGSGAFPMGILTEIFSARKALHSVISSDPFIASEVKKEIIQNNIYGVDIEQGAVDIARLRFWLSLVVDEQTPQPLPNLDYKIMQGNSLLESFEGIDLSNFSERSTELNLFGTDETKDEIKKLTNKYFAVTDHVIKHRLRTEIDEKVHEHIKRSCGHNPSIVTKVDEIEPTKRPFFLWHVYFNDVFANGGFDIVIGNPPYLRIQGIRDTDPKFANAVGKLYKSATGSFDLYALFTERALIITNAKGIANFIMPIKWSNSAFGKGLRGFISEQKAVSKIVNFGAYQVFNASTYTALQWFAKGTEKLLYTELDRNLTTNKELGLYLEELKDDRFTKISTSKLDSDAWVLTVGKITTLLNKLDLQPRRMKDIFEKIFQGLATSKDDVYFLYKCKEEESRVIGYSKYLEREIIIERGLVKPLLKGEDVHRYDNISSDRYVVFPYKLENGKANLFEEMEIAKLFPLGYSYLKECETELRGRERGRLMNDEFWYRYIYPKNLTLFANEKLVAPYLSLGGNFTYDYNGEFYATTKIYGYKIRTGIKEPYKFWLGLLNSKLVWTFIQNTGAVFRGGYYVYAPEYINPFPVPAEFLPEMVSAIEALVDNILELKKQDPKTDTTALEKEIDKLVYTLYELTDEEIATIENEGNSNQV